MATRITKAWTQAHQDALIDWLHDSDDALFDQAESWSRAAHRASNRLGFEVTWQRLVVAVADIPDLRWRGCHYRLSFDHRAYDPAQWTDLERQLRRRQREFVGMTPSAVANRLCCAGSTFTVPAVTAMATLMRLDLKGLPE